MDSRPFVDLTVKAGQVSVHHGLSMHCTKPKTAPGHRRFVIYNFRARDAIQLAGPIFKSTGHQVRDGALTNTARFPDGTVVHLRGHGGRLYDLEGKLRPNT